MKCLIQRVTEAAVWVAGQCVGEVAAGLLVFVAIEPKDTIDTVSRMTERLVTYRVFSDGNGRMNLNVNDVDGGLLLVSQFTLAADTRKGTRPGFQTAAAPPMAEALFGELIESVRQRHSPVATGVFGADMQVSLVNDGPVTFLLEV